MASGLQHCPSCDEEYVAGVAACVECGGPLQPGPLARLERGARTADSERTTAGPPRPDRLLAELPGLQADHAVRALLLEGVACGVECRGVRKVYVPGEPPAEPFAVTLPVTVYVSDAQYETAQDIVASFQTDDMIGDQWTDGEAEPDEAALIEVEPTGMPVDENQHVLAGEALADDEPTPESTSLRTVVVIVVVAVVLLFLFGR